MGGKLSKKKKGCNGDSKDEKSEESSEIQTTEQKENEIEVDNGRNNAAELNVEQPESSTSKFEDHSKNELQEVETVNEEKEADETTQNQTKEGQITQQSDKLKHVQNKNAENELLNENCQERDHVPEVGSSFTEEQTCKETRLDTVENQVEQKCQQLKSLPTLQTEEKSEINDSIDPKSHSPKEKETISDSTRKDMSNKVSVNIQTTHGDISIANLTKGTMHEENKNNADELRCSPTEDTCNVPSAKDKQDAICSNTENLPEKDTHSKPTGAEILVQYTCPNLLQESQNIEHISVLTVLEDKKHCDVDRVENGQQNSDNDKHLIISHVAILSNNHSFYNSNETDDHKHVATLLNNSDKLGTASQLQMEESYNCKLNNTAQENKLKDKAMLPTECLNMDDKCSVQQDTCATAVEEDSWMATEEESRFDKINQKGPADQTACLAQIESEMCLVPQLEASISLDNSLAPAKLETQVQAGSSVCQATVAAPNEMKVSLTQAEVASKDEQKASVTPMKVESTAVEPETYMTPVEMESPTEPEAFMAPAEVASLVKLVDSLAQGVEISSSEPEICVAITETSPAELEDCVGLTLVASSSELEACVVPAEVASPGELENGVAHTEVASPGGLDDCGDQTELASLAELEASVDPVEVLCPPELEDSVAQTEVLSQAETDSHVTQTEVASPSELESFVAPGNISFPANLEAFAAPAEVDCPTELEDSVAQTEVLSQAEIDSHVTQTEVASSSELEAFVASVNISSPANLEARNSSAEVVCPKELEMFAVPAETEIRVASVKVRSDPAEPETCVACQNDTSDPAELEAYVAPREAASSSNPNIYEDSAEMETLTESDAYNATENQGEGQMSGEGQLSLDPMCQVEPEYKVGPATVQEKQMNLDSIPVNEVEHPNDVNVHSEQVICEDMSVKSNGVNNEVVNNSNSQIRHEFEKFEKHTASSGSPQLLSEKEEFETYDTSLRNESPWHPESDGEYNEENNDIGNKTGMSKEKGSGQDSSTSATDSNGGDIEDPPNKIKDIAESTSDVKEKQLES